MIGDDVNYDLRGGNPRIPKKWPLPGPPPLIIPGPPRKFPLNGRPLIIPPLPLGMGGIPLLPLIGRPPRPRVIGMNSLSSCC